VGDRGEFAGEPIATQGMAQVGKFSGGNSIRTNSVLVGSESTQVRTARAVIGQTVNLRQDIETKPTIETKPIETKRGASMPRGPGW
jgi:hypothetical protein